MLAGRVDVTMVASRPRLRYPGAPGPPHGGRRTRKQPRRAGPRSERPPPRALRALGRDRPDRDPGKRSADLRRRGERPIDIRAGPQRRLAGLDGRSAAGPGQRHAQRRQLSGADADHVRRLRRDAGRGARASAVAASDRRGDRGRKRDPAAGPAADLSGRVRLHGVRPHGRAARPGPVHARRVRSPDRPDLSVHRLAVSALALRTAVHALQATPPPRWGWRAGCGR